MALILHHNDVARPRGTNGQSASVERLSSGRRILTAADDAIGLEIAEKMRAGLKALSLNMENCNGTLLALQATDGALQIINANLSEMRELALQSATGTSDPEKIARYESMKMEIDRVAGTEFDGTKIFCSGNVAKDPGAIIVHFGSGTEEDACRIERRDCTIKGLGMADSTIETPDKARKACDAIAAAILSVDEARSYFGTMMNDVAGRTA